MEERVKVVLINITGMLSLIGITFLIYVRTNEPLILVIGGLILAVIVLGTVMR